MNEHSGGTPKVGLISIDSWSEESFQLHPVFEWDPASLDLFSDIVKERIKAGQDPKEILVQALSSEIQLLIACALRRAVGFIRESRKPRLVADQIGWIAGVALFEGVTVGQLASRHGISKQAFQQGADKLREPLFPIRSQSARPAAARERMRLRNSRRTKNEALQGD